MFSKNFFRKRPRTSSRGKSDLKKPTGKIKTNKPIKPITISPKKWNVGKKHKRRPKGDLIQNGELDLNWNDDDDGAEEINDYVNRNEEPGTPDRIDVEQDINKKREEDINVESIPSIFKTVNWDDIEIEIVDQAKENNTVTTTKHKTIVGNTIEIEIIDQIKTNEQDKNAELIETSDPYSNRVENEEDIKEQSKNVNIKNKTAQKTEASNKISSIRDDDDVLNMKVTPNEGDIKNRKGQQSTKKINKILSNEDVDEIIMIDKPKEVIENQMGYKNTKTHNKTGSSSDDDEPLSVSCRTRTYKRGLKEEPTQDTLFPPKKKERRDQVRREVKSRFKRLGMLPVANFEEK